MFVQSVTRCFWSARPHFFFWAIGNYASEIDGVAVDYRLTYTRPGFVTFDLHRRSLPAVFRIDIQSDPSIYAKTLHVLGFRVD